MKLKFITSNDELVICSTSVRFGDVHDAISMIDCHTEHERRLLLFADEVRTRTRFESIPRHMHSINTATATRESSIRVLLADVL